ncbi:hypothetical protein [Sulfurihydrogenibium sp.]|uniref:hypothetical protein n=1 Tax=Sulfurihydrogenibium sp. TaxID=2053621 RepID=UPI00260F2E96|nr:hypothetical protein [Sulfurihydrogenibium sp.]
MLKRKSNILLMIIFLIFSTVKAEPLNLPPIKDLNPFLGLETTVGYIQKENGEKFLVIETPDGTKLVKVKTDPKKLIEKETK